MRSDLRRLGDGEGGEFEIGRNDYPPRLLVSQRLHGRAKELAAVESAFERIRQGRSELVLVHGHAGIGKTRLIDEVRPTFLRCRANFLAGKYEQFHDGVPYSAMLFALSRFVHQILAEPEGELKAWRRDADRRCR